MTDLTVFQMLKQPSIVEQCNFDPTDCYEKFVRNSIKKRQRKENNVEHESSSAVSSEENC
ncbi:MAG: hypothetical protein PHQ00_07700 [Phycisphaerae bacterium]|nr:hypothetical protein [Phycisphaerae bacterium]